jgi:hypothetical protein
LARKQPQPNQEPVSFNRDLLVSLLAQGYSSIECPAEVELIHPGVDHDLVIAAAEAIQERWRRTALADPVLQKGKEVSILNKVSEESFKAWNRSLIDIEEITEDTTISNNKSSIKRTTKKIPGRGDPRWLAEITKCVAKRSELLELAKPAVPDPDALPPLLRVELVDGIELDEPPPSE